MCVVCCPKEKPLTRVGWAPSTFKSSRSQRANKVQRPEDFMDEEDLAQMNDDRRIESTEAFRKDAFATTKEELANRRWAQPPFSPHCEYVSTERTMS